MRTTIDNASFTLRDRDINALPACPGVYRFFDAGGQLLYVGKSIDIRTRVRSHYATAQRPGRHQRMMRAVQRIDSEPCSGEVGALLRENTAIKREIPLYNRRQRRQRYLWTLSLVPAAGQFLQARPQQLSGRGIFAGDCYGLYQSQAQGEDRLRQLARDGGLCLRALGLEHGRGPCFSYQLRRCRGACAGVESATSHNARLREALLGQRILAWPFPSAVLLRETAADAHDGQPRHDWHAVDQWHYVGSFHRARTAVASIAAAGTGEAVFDRDAYFILLRALRGGIRVYSASSLEPLKNPLAQDKHAA